MCLCNITPGEKDISHYDQSVIKSGRKFKESDLYTVKARLISLLEDLFISGLSCLSPLFALCRNLRTC